MASTIVCQYKKAYLALVVSFFVVSLGIIVESFFTVESVTVVLTESVTLVESVFVSVLELLLQAAKAPIASTKKNFFMFKFLILIEWFPVNTQVIKK